MKKIFILTGEPSGDKLASTAISKLKKNYSDIEYLSVGGSNLKKIGIITIQFLLNGFHFMSSICWITQTNFLFMEFFKC